MSTKRLSWEIQGAIIEMFGYEGSTSEWIQQEIHTRFSVWISVDYINKLRADVRQQKRNERNSRNKRRFQRGRVKDKYIESF